MKLKFKHQKFQADAAKAVTDVFAGQPYETSTYMIDQGRGNLQGSLFADDFTGFKNHKIVPGLTNEKILNNIRNIQRSNLIKPSDKLEGTYNLTIEMETGVGKTYTYIKTIYELNKLYGWSKFIIVVPSIAIREGVYKSFEVTQDHFAEEYGKKIHFFIYNSSQLAEINQFASDSNINVMIINSQAFNATGKDARRIYMELDEFQSRKPIDVIAKTNPIVIIDEPQSVEGKKTKENLKKFNPLMTLRYSATHKSDSIYNMVYRLDAMDAYNKNLVKKIAVKGIEQKSSSASEGYVYLEGINLSKSAPTATVEFEVKGKNSVRKTTRIVSEGFNLYEHSGGLEEYRKGFTITRIDGRDNSIEFVNGTKIYAGDVIGDVSEDQLRRIQIRETILSHLERERDLFYKGIKVLSLFFIDEVDKYRQYDAAGDQKNGLYAEMFEQEYQSIVDEYLKTNPDDDYSRYLKAITAHDTHAGYFSIDKKGKMIDSKVKKAEGGSDDIDAYDLIMKNKELLLDRDPKRSPVRFIFSHSALREGWDNPNVFQICTLKQSNSEVRKRQEVGRGLRLCVNQNGDRMDSTVLGADVHNVNLLTVIASESYDSFAKGLQTEMAEAIAERPVKIEKALFTGKTIKDIDGNESSIDDDTALTIYESLIENGYVKKGVLTDKYYEDKANGTVQFPEEVIQNSASILDILDSVYDPRVLQPEDARGNNVELKVGQEKLNAKEFRNLWNQINKKSVYVVDFDTEELIANSIRSLDNKLRVPKIYYQVRTGMMDGIKSKEDLESGNAMTVKTSKTMVTAPSAGSHVKYDLVGKLVENTGLTRKTIVRILKGIREDTFNQFKDNPEEFIIRASNIINDEKATAIIQHITYDVLDDEYGTDIFTDASIRGKLGVNAMKANKHLFDHVRYDSTNEEKFAKELDTSDEVSVYVKLPDGFFISTPVGKYNPDWAIAFYEGKIKHIYFVAETKGSLDSLNLNHITPIEQAKIDCARQHFKAISSDNVKYDVVSSYDDLVEKVMK